MPPAAPRASVRIIAGKHRGQVLRPRISTRQCRPSGDRTRESLFNHLGQWLAGWHCLDLFAGSGALGFESLSRGAAAVTFVERDARLARALQQTARTLGETPTVHHMSAYRFLHHKPTPFNLIFLDPPFSDYQNSEAWQQLLARVRGWLAPRGIVYCESEIPVTMHSDRWQQLVAKKYGQVHWHLLTPADVP